MDATKTGALKDVAEKEEVMTLVFVLEGQSFAAGALWSQAESYGHTHHKQICLGGQCPVLGAAHANAELDRSPRGMREKCLGHVAHDPKDKSGQMTPRTSTWTEYFICVVSTQSSGEFADSLDTGPMDRTESGGQIL